MRRRLSSLIDLVEVRLFWRLDHYLIKFIAWLSRKLSQRSIVVQHTQTTPRTYNVYLLDHRRSLAGQGYFVSDVEIHLIAARSCETPFEMLICHDDGSISIHNLRLSPINIAAGDTVVVKVT